MLLLAVHVPDLLLGAAIGLVLSYGQWHVLAHIIIPRIRAGEFVSNRLLDNTDPRGLRHLYRVRIRNVSRFRTILDLTVWSIVRVPRYDAQRPKLTGIIPVPVQDVPVPALSPRRMWYFSLFTEKIPESALRYLPRDIVETLKREEHVTLETLLTLRPGSHLRLYVAGFDKFSGARRVYQSRDYFIDDIQPKRFPNPPTWWRDLLYGLSRHVRRFARRSMSRKADDLLEGRPVGPAHRVGEEAGEVDALGRRVGAPG